MRNVRAALILDQLEDARMRPFLAAHPACGVGLTVVNVPIDVFEVCDGREQEPSAEATSQADENARAQRNMSRRHRDPGGSQLRLPNRRVAFLHIGQPPVDGREVLVTLHCGHRAIYGGAVDLVLEVGAIPL